MWIWLQYHRRWLITGAVALAAISLGRASYGWLGHDLIESAYRGESLGFLTRMMEARHDMPLEFYLGKADRLVFRACLYGTLATLLIVGSGVWLRRFTRKKAAITVVAPTVTLAALSAINAVRLDLVAFERGAARLVERSEELIRRAGTVSEAEILAGLGPNPHNGPYYRFEERLEEAVVETGAPTSSEPDSSETASGWRLDFEGHDPVSLVSQRGGEMIRSGVLRTTYRRKDYLATDAPLSIDKDAIGEIELRLRLHKGRRIEIGWSNDATVQWKEPQLRNIGSLVVDTVPDGQFHVYRIHAKTVLRRRLSFGDTIARFFLIPSHVEGDVVDIDYIHFLSKVEKYARKPYAASYETIGREMRRVLYMKTPLALRYTVTVPDSGPRLAFGTGILLDGDPVSFRVAVGAAPGGEREELYAETVADNTAWNAATLDLGRWAGQMVEIVFEAESAAGNIAFWSHPKLDGAPAERFNVIVVLEDTLRADHLSAYGYPRATSPAKERLHVRGVRFVNAFSQATMTRPSVASLMTSLYPTATGVWSFSESLSERYTTLAEVLRSQGFTTAAFLQNPNAGPVAGLHQGFDRLLDAGIVGERAEQIYGPKLRAWLAEHADRNFFLYLHLIDPHKPYNPPAPYDRWYREAPQGRPAPKDTSIEPDWVEAPTVEGRRLLYDGEIRYNDEHFGRFWQQLTESGLLDDTLVVFLSDHGEHLGEHGLWLHRPPGYIQVLRVPLLFFYPQALPRETEIHPPVQLLDVMPTILELAGVAREGLLLQGDSLVDLMLGEAPDYWEERLCVSEEVVNREKESESDWGSLFYKRWHILNTDLLADPWSEAVRWPSRTLYERAFATRFFDYVADPAEEAPRQSFFFDLFLKNRTRRCLRRLQENNQILWKLLTGGSQQLTRYDPEEMERLRALGYLQ